MPASPRHRPRCDLHEARAGIIALISCCLVRPSTGGLDPPDETLPACTQRRIRLSMISEAGAKLCFSLYSTEQPTQIQNQSDFRATHRAGPTSKPLQSRPKKILSPLVSPSPLVLQLCRCPTGFPHAWRTIFCNPEDPNALGDDSSFFAVTQHQWRACVRRLPHCKLACVLPPSSVDSTSASGAFAVA